MNFYKIVVAYDGTAYHGWQQQEDATTISQTMADRFSAVFFQPIAMLGASRTDKGVHALGQVVIVRTPLDLSADVLLRVWNKMLPDDIVIKQVDQLNALVHPHDGVIQKTYAYHFFIQRPAPFVQRFGWHVYHEIDLDLLQQALNIFVGTHDFRSFCTGNDLHDTVRTIDSITLSYVKEWDAYRIEFKGKSFLRYMIRRIVGACLCVATRKQATLQDIEYVLQQKNPCHTLPNAPAKGLVLERIQYETQGEFN